MGVALLKVLRILLLLALLVGLLDATARWGVVVTRGEADHGAVGQVDGALHKSLTKGASAHHEAAVVVLNSPCHNFSSRSAKLVDQHHHAPLLKEAAALCHKHLLGLGAPFGVDHKVAFVEELARHLKGRAQIAAAIAFEIEDEVTHPLLEKFGNSLLHLLARSRSEAVELNVTDSGGDHIGRTEGVDGNFIARHGELHRFRYAPAHDAQIGFCAARTTQEGHDAVALHLDAGNDGVAHRDDAVAGQDAHFFRRAFGHGLNDYQGIFEHVELHADAFKIAFQRFVHFLRLLGVGVGGVGVELFENTVDGIFHQFLLVDRVDVELCDGELRQLEFADLLHIDTFVHGLSLCCERQDSQSTEKEEEKLFHKREG